MRRRDILVARVDNLVVTLNTSDFRSYISHFWRDVWRLRLGALFVVGLALLAIRRWAGSGSSAELLGPVAFIGALLALVGMIMIVIMILFVQPRRLARRMPERIDYAISGSGIRYTYSEASGTTPWKLIQGIQRSRFHVYLLIGAREAIIIPMRCMEDANLDVDAAVSRWEAWRTSAPESAAQAHDVSESSVQNSVIFTMQEKDFWRNFVYNHLIRQPYTLYIYLLLAVVLFGGVSIYYLLTAPGTAVERFAAAIPAYLVFTASIGFSAALLYIILRLRVRKQFHASGIGDEPITVRISADALNVHSRGADARWTWNDIEDIVSTRHLDYIYLAGNRVVAIPAHAFSASQARAHFQAEMCQYADNSNTD